MRAPIFVNRGPELAALADALDAVRASARRFVLISGEHGAGKSALCDAFVRTAHAGGPVRVCHGQSFDRELPQRTLLRIPGRAHRPRSSPSRGTCRGFAANAPSWLAQFPQWNGAGTPAVHAVRMFDELGAALAALFAIGATVHPRRSPRADADSVNALARLAESQDSLEAADRRHLLRWGLDGPESVLTSACCRLGPRRRVRRCCCSAA